MSPANDGHDAVEVLLAGATKTIGNARYCWLVTTAEDGGANPRPMGRVPSDADEDEWTMRFITDGRSRKVTDMRRADRVAIIFQHAPDDAFVTLIGKATLHESESEVGERWNDAYDAYFSGEAGRANAIFVVVDIERIEHPRRHRGAVWTAYDDTRARRCARLARDFPMTMGDKEETTRR